MLFIRRFIWYSNYISLICFWTVVERCIDLNTNNKMLYIGFNTQTVSNCWINIDLLNKGINQMEIKISTSCYQKQIPTWLPISDYSTYTFTNVCIKYGDLSLNRKGINWIKVRRHRNKPDFGSTRLTFLNKVWFYIKGFYVVIIIEFIIVIIIFKWVDMKFNI